jgi:RNA-directed DNA polymerase
MTTAPISLQDLRRSLYVKAKAEPSWRFWGLYFHVCKMETLREAYQMARSNDGAPGIDGVTFEAIEESGAEGFLEQIRDELVTNTYRPMARGRKGLPWKRRGSEWLYEGLGLFHDYQLRRWSSAKVAPAR